MAHRHSPGTFCTRPGCARRTRLDLSGASDGACAKCRKKDLMKKLFQARVYGPQRDCKFGRCECGRCRHHAGTDKCEPCSGHKRVTGRKGRPPGDKTRYCNECEGMSWRRWASGCVGCGQPYAQEDMTDARAGSLMRRG